MKNSKKAKQITTLIIIFPLITLLIYGGLSHLFFSYFKKIDNQKELNRYEKIILDTQKRGLVEKVENLTQFIRYYNYKSSDKIKEETKRVVNSVAKILNSLYFSYKYKLSEENLQKLIISTLRNINKNSGKRYIFMIDTNGNVLMHINPKIIGTNVINLRDIGGKYFIKEFLGVIENSKEGYVDYYWQKPNSKDNKMYYKISFIKLLDMYNWIIGSGEYLKDMQKKVSKEILAYIKDNSHFRGGYFFVTNSKNKIIFAPEDKDIKNFEDLRIDGVYEDDKKIAYTSYVAEYDWYITAVKSMSVIREKIAQQTKLKENQIKKDTTKNIYLLIGTWILSLSLSLYLSLIVNKMLKKYEKMLEESNEKLIFQSRQALIGELFSMIAHQWRQPINKIASIVAPLRFETKDKKLDKELKKIEDSIQFMSNTIDDFRTFYKPKGEPEVVNLKLLIEKSIDFLSQAIRKKDIKIIKELEDIKLKIYGNEFLQVMINLINNAIDAIEKDGEICIKLYKKDNRVVIIVEDNGKGIDIKKTSKIFDPYYTTKKDSMGLGLYMSRLIIQKHLKGAIEVIPLKKGVRFIIVLSDNHK
jgi:signal transduction histidine kinase/succinate dehydrogenase flavin-adding protein (antitoxin of CptAB toxin-antitoxin module)